MKLLEPRIQPIQKNELTTEQRKLLDPLGQTGRLNVFKTLIRYPKLFQRFLVFGRYILEESALPPRDRELLILRTACLCQAEYEWSHNAISGEQAGLTNKEIPRIMKGPNTKGWSSFDAALLGAVDELYKNTFISDSTWDALARRYSEQHLVDRLYSGCIQPCINGFNQHWGSIGWRCSWFSQVKWDHSVRSEVRDLNEISSTRNEGEKKAKLFQLCCVYTSVVFKLGGHVYPELFSYSLVNSCL